MSPAELTPVKQHNYAAAFLMLRKKPFPLIIRCHANDYASETEVLNVFIIAMGNLLLKEKSKQSDCVTSEWFTDLALLIF